MNTFERSWEWSGYNIRKSKTGWIVEGWSSIQGQNTGTKVLIKPVPSHGLYHDIDLNGEWNDCLTVGEYIAALAKDYPDKILCAIVH